MMSLWDALRMNMMISYQELVRTFLNYSCMEIIHIKNNRPYAYKYNQYIDGSIFIMIRQMEGET